MIDPIYLLCLASFITGGAGGALLVLLIYWDLFNGIRKS